MTIAPVTCKEMVPFSPALPMVTTVLTLRAEQKRTEEVVREALAKAQETCLALTTENAALRAEIVILQGRLETAEGIHAASLRAKDAQIAALLAQVKALQDQRTAEKVAKKALAKAVKDISDKTPDYGMYLSEGALTVQLARIFRAEVLKLVQDYSGVDF